MNRNTATIGSQGHTRNACWSSEWSFIEDEDVVLQKSARSPIIEELVLVYQANTGSKISQSGTHLT